MATTVGQINFGVGVDAGRIASDVQSALRPALARIQRQLDRNPLRISVVLDTSGLLRDLANIRRQVEAATSSVNLDVNVRVDQSSVARVTALRGTLSRLGSSAGGILRTSAAIAAVGGAAGVATAAVGGLLAAAVALGPALAAVGATAAVGLQGVGDAFSAMSAVTANAAADARAQADAVASAQDAMASAAAGAQSAQRGLASAQQASARAAEDVADAYETAQERLEGYRTSLRGAALDEREAKLNLAEAQQALAESQRSADPLERERALIRVERAELNLARATEDNKDLQEEATEALAKGVDKSREVVAAKRAQAQADQQVVAAQQGVAQAARAVAQASSQLAEAQTGASASSQKFADTLVNLAPNAQSFVLAAQALQPAMESFRRSVQDTLFANLGAQLTETANVVLPALQQSMGGVASQLNLGAQNALEFLRSAQGMRGLNAAFANGSELLEGLQSGTGEFSQGLVDATASVTPQMQGLGRAIAAIGEGFGAALSDVAQSGALEGALAGLSQVLTSLGPLIGDLVVSFVSIADTVLPSLAPLFVTLGAVIRSLAPVLGDIGVIFAESLTEILPPLGNLIRALLEGLQPVLPIIAELIGVVAEALTPLIEPFSRIAVILGETLVTTIEALAPALLPLATAFADLVEAVAPFVPMIAQVVATIVEALAPALSVIFEALGPVIQIFAEQMKPVIEELAPILANVAMTLGVAIADALVQLTPLLPPLITAWSELVLAIVPLLPQLADMIVNLLPPLVDILITLAPVIVKIIEAFTWLVSNVIIPLVMPVIRQLAEEFRRGFEIIGSVVSFVVDTVFPKIGDAINRVKGWFSDGVSAISDIWAGLKEAAAVPVNFVIETVWNNGLLKAWESVDSLLGGVLPDATRLEPIPTRATGGSIGYTHGRGNGTKDDILTWLSNGEHVVTAAEVVKAGGQDILFAIRDMIARGIPFEWNNGSIIPKLGRDNLSAYGAEVRQQGIGNVSPEGMFYQLPGVKGLAGGGPVMPWMHQLKAGHDFARAQDGKPYQWAGPRFVGDSFDCSGFMASIAAAILGEDPWRRYWATSSFAGYPQFGPQGFESGRKSSGMVIGVTDDPGGPGGGHTAGVLRGLPQLGIPSDMRVESGGAIGDVHYGRGTDPTSFASLYGLPIGPNGFFQSPISGGAQNGPSTEAQSSFLSDFIGNIVRTVTGPVRDLISSTIGVPPPAVKGLPLAVLESGENAFISVMSSAVGGLGDLLGGAWQKAKDVGSGILDFVNPFDNGGVASGTGFLAKNIIDPERVLSPEQTKLFEALVAALQNIATTAVSAAGRTAQTVVVDISENSVDALRSTLGIDARTEDAAEVITRTASSAALVAQRANTEQLDLLLSIANKLSSQVLGPIMSSAVNAGVGIINDFLTAVGEDIVGGTDRTTRAVERLGADVTTPGAPAPAPFGAPGSAFDLTSAISDAVVSVANAATSAFQAVAADVVNSALAQTRSDVGEQSRGQLGTDVSGGFLVDFIVRLTGVEIEILDLLENTYEEIQAFREDSVSGSTATGQLISDTAALVQRNQSSMALAAEEAQRIQEALIKAVIKYLITAVLIPILTAVLGAMITIATTAIGAAIGSVIPVIGTAIGAAIGASVGAALAGLASVFISLLAVGAGAALSAFDEGGVAHGLGYMPKNTLQPERVLSPRQTASFEQLVQVLDRDSVGNRTVQVGSINVNGRDPAQRTADNLLSLLNV